ncbi:MAG: hypothetical protein RhofKO_39760 [Rhodothermales bacterium]
MPALHLFEAVLTAIFAKMSRLHNSHVGLRQQRFIAELTRVLLAHLGRANFTNLARFSHLHEHTFRRHFTRFFDWASFNLVLLRLTLHPRETHIAVFDTSFLPKAGKRTYSLDKFFSHAAKTMCTGLEVSLLGVIGVESRRTVALDATQTPSGLSRRTEDQKYSRIDFYLHRAPQGVAAQVDGLPPLRTTAARTSCTISGSREVVHSI